MKPEVKKLVSAFAETALAVKLRLKKSGFVLPVSHNGGIKFKHCFIKKNSNGWYNVTNLHNPKIKYYTDIASHKIAVALAIYLGQQVNFKEKDLLDADHEYMHYFNELRIFKHHLAIAEKRSDDLKIDIYTARIEEYTPRFERAKKQVSYALYKAESLLFTAK